MQAAFQVLGVEILDRKLWVSFFFFCAWIASVLAVCLFSCLFLYVTYSDSELEMILQSDDVQFRSRGV